MFESPAGGVGLPDHDGLVVVSGLGQGLGPGDPGLAGGVVLVDGVHPSVRGHVLPAADQQKSRLKE